MPMPSRCGGGPSKARRWKPGESRFNEAVQRCLKLWVPATRRITAYVARRGNLMLSVLARSLNHYYLYTADNQVQPSNFIGNRVAGILFENKCDHTTYFGTHIEYMQGIHMLPLLPSSKLTRPANFVRQEWSAYFDNGRADQVQGGWKGILYGNLAMVDPSTAWNFFTSSSFDPSWLDGGASLTLYQTFCAGEFFFPCRKLRRMRPVRWL